MCIRDRPIVDLRTYTEIINVLITRQLNWLEQQTHIWRSLAQSQAEPQTKKMCIRDSYWTLTDPDYPNLCEQACRKAVTHYSESTIAKKYIDLYNKVTGRNA